jgi:NhaP-type Na+/H+ or K+/H+ antiporter
MLEGESLLNDASGLTLFEVFFHLVSSCIAIQPPC